MSEVKVPRMRTIEQCAKYIKDADPDSQMSAWRIRAMVNASEIPHTMCGRKILINLDRLLEYLADGSREVKTENESKIRKLVV